MTPAIETGISSCLGGQSCDGTALAVVQSKGRLFPPVVVVVVLDVGVVVVVARAVVVVDVLVVVLVEVEVVVG
jgi:hypothetical protein